MAGKQHIVHPIPPVYDENSKILILGSFPSVASREVSFFYGHPRNRFWKLMAMIYEEKEMENIEEKKDFLLRNHIALWDVIGECEIEGSSDASIRDVVPNDLDRILNKCEIRHIYVNGQTAGKMYHKYSMKSTGRDCIILPSTSPANAACSIDDLYEQWKIIKED